MTLLVLQVVAAPGFPATSRPRGGGNISLRKRLHVNSLITDPGTGEIDGSGLYSFSTGGFSLPAAVKFTPRGTHIAWGRTEYSLAFDSLTSDGQAVSLTATSVLYDGDSLDLAIAPQAVLFLRDEAGARLGATAIARYDKGHSSLGTTVGWSGATHSSPTNPPGTFDLGLGFGQNLPAAEKFTPHCNVVWERSTGKPASLALFEGIEYQMTERVALDLSAQHLGVRGGPADHQLVFGLTVNLGKLH